MRIIGVDPGVAIIGIALVDSPNAHDCLNPQWLTIETAAHTPFLERLQEIADDLSHLLKETQPDLAVVERIFFATNEKTAIDVAQARGVILLTIAREGIPIIEPSPMQLKLAIAGDGRASKEQLQKMLTHLLSLPSPPKPDDAADALALAVYGALIQHAPSALREGTPFQRKHSKRSSAVKRRLAGALP